jgi:hypothetical protein
MEQSRKVLTTVKNKISNSKRISKFLIGTQCNREQLFDGWKIFKMVALFL